MIQICEYSQWKCVFTTNINSSRIDLIFETIYVKIDKICQFFRSVIFKDKNFLAFLVLSD